MSSRTTREQLELFRILLKDKTYDRDSDTYKAAIKWFKMYPGALSPDEQEEMYDLFSTAFNLSRAGLEEELTGVSPVTSEALVESRKKELERAAREEREFLSLLPKSGFFHDYIKYTSENESPAVYHFFCAVAGLAAVLNRRIGLPWGTGKLYPVLGVIILGPSGLKKTSAGDIIIDLLNNLELVPIYSEKVTPEALIESMKGGNTIGLVYAPEMAVFLGKQSYLEGLVPLLTRFMDSPDKWSGGTISRGKVMLEGIGITSLMCSTIDWFVKNTPEDMFGGGFIARNLLIVQEACARIFPIPKPVDENLKRKLIGELVALHEFQGDVSFSPDTLREFVSWYHQHKMSRAEFEVMETYYQRKDKHVLRLTMMLHLAEHGTMQICTECFFRALAIFDWLEKYLPKALRQMFKSEAGEKHEFIVKMIKSEGGTIAHTKLVKKTQFKMNANELRNVLQSLKEANRITENINKTTRAHTYTLIGEVE